ncbi:MAG: choice-of-anchor D domain-containing protein [Flavobacteriaceae bacterium]|nr:choice-of-anchor D domain-containing protein [Flavobacteriaceae bacterium]
MNFPFPKPLENGVIAFFLLLFVMSNAQTPDFKVQHIQDDVARSGGTNTGFTAVNSINSAVELSNNNRKSNAGSPTTSANLNGDDLAGARQLTSANTLTYYRESGSLTNDMRFNTSIWEYIGPSGGGNELIVRGRYAVSLNGGTNSITQPLTGIGNANKCIPFITGIMNNSTSQDADSGTALAYLENATTLRVQKGSNGNNVTVYITLVEFTGSNWTVLHGDSGNVSSDTGTITLRNGSDGTGTATNVSGWSDAIIFSHFRADTNASGTNDAIADLWPITEPGNNNQRVDWTFHSEHDSSGTNRHFVHVLVNSGLNVTRFQNSSNSAFETTINITSAGLSDINQALIVGSSTSSGTGIAYARGWRNYYLNSTTQAAHWSHRSGNTMSHEIQIIDLSGLQTTFSGPEINIQGNGVNIPDGNTTISTLDDTDFGTVVIAGGASVSHTFTIQNLGSSTVNLTDLSPYITITGSTADFTLTSNPSPTISGSGSTTFTITYNPTTSGTHTATISIANNDANESLYTFKIQGQGSYCNSYGHASWNDGITYVSFNTINNADILKDVGYENFTNISTNVYRGSLYDLNVRLNTDGNYINYANVWIDWNRDGDFDDAGEAYNLGSVTNNSDGLTSNSPITITVPLAAVIGTTRMRVSTKYNAYPSSSCEANFDGEVEDYTINIIDNLIDFNGVDGHVNFGDNHDLNGSFSLEAWVYQENTVSTGAILSKGNIDTSLKTGYHLSLKNNYPNLIWYDNSNNEVVNITSPFAIPNNQWHHIATTYDGSTVKMYIDGIEVIFGTTSSFPLNTLQEFIIGSDISNASTAPLNINFFDGAIQEVRVWDVALAETQIREMMNQHIEQNITNVKGFETKLDISGGLQWSNLLGYYPLNSNTAIDSSGNNIDGVPQNINSSQIVTAPLPYKTNGDNAWDTALTWLHNTDVYIPNTRGVDGVTSIDWNIVELSNDIISGDRDISLNGLIILGGKLTIADPNDAQNETNSGQSLTITRYLELDGIIDLVGESQLIQTEGSILDADSGGYIERDQQGTANSFNYNYWSSSVSPISGNLATRGNGISSSNTNHTISQILKDGSNSSLYQDLNFTTSPNVGASSPPPGIARTVSSYWLYKFYGTSNDYYSWNKINENTPLIAGEGFTMKGTSGSVAISTKQNYVFQGLPNNGDIQLPLVKSSGDVNRLIGNPYPSAISADEFILDNLSLADGGNNTIGTVFNGTLYFWDHFGQQNSHVLGDYVGGYATYNLTGGVPAISNISLINNNGQTGTKTPGDYIAVNQGFFVSTDGVAGGTIVFKNRQRIFAVEDGSTSTFFKASSKKDKSTNSISTNSTPRIKLLYSSPMGYNRQIVIGAKEKATNGFDFGYDAFIADVNKEDMYWTFNEGKFVIQGVNNFDDSQEFSLGLIVKKAGTVIIKIHDIENIDSSKKIYIKDGNTGEVIEINNSPFEVHLEPGTYEERFKLVFQSNSELLGNKGIDLENNFSVFYNSESSLLNIVLNNASYSSEGAIFNLLGQKLDSIKAFTNNISISKHISTGVYIIQLKTDLGVINKKIIIE